MRPSERLVERLRAELVDVPQDWVLHRTYAGEADRTAGAWSWFIDLPNLRTVGSQHTIIELLKGRIEIDWNRERDYGDSRSIRFADPSDLLKE